MNDSLYEKFDIKNEYKVVPCISCDTEEEDAKKGADKAAYGLLEFERPVVIVPGCKGKYLIFNLVRASFQDFHAIEAKLQKGSFHYLL